MLKSLIYWKSKFRILKDWNISLCEDEDSEYTGQCCQNTKTKMAEIFPWGEGEEEKDYIFHELVHICMADIRDKKPYKKRRESEELFVQDLCTIIFRENNIVEGK